MLYLTNNLKYNVPYGLYLMLYTPDRLGAPLGRLQWHLTSPRWTWVSPRPLSLGLVAWEAYSDWVISPSPGADVLMSLQFPGICTDLPCIWVHIFHWLPPCYSMEIGHPEFDRIELTLSINKYNKLLCNNNNNN